jgi:hypothetical protein
MKADKLDFLANKSLSELKGLAAELKLEPNGDRRLKSTWFDLSIEYRCPGIKKRAAKLRDLAGGERLRLLLEEERHPTIAIRENSPGAALVQEPIEKSLDVDRARNAYRVTYRKIPGCRSRPQCLSNSPIWNLHSLVQVRDSGRQIRNCWNLPDRNLKLLAKQKTFHLEYQNLRARPSAVICDLLAWSNPGTKPD